MADRTIGEHRISVELTRRGDGGALASSWTVERYFRNEHESISCLVAITASLSAVVNSERSALMMRDALRMLEFEQSIALGEDEPAAAPYLDETARART